MSARLILFIQALVFFVVGLYLSSLGLPSDEVSVVQYTGNEILDVLGDVSDSPEVHGVVENTKSSLATLGFFMTIISILELIALGISVFAQNGYGRI